MSRDVTVLAKLRSTFPERKVETCIVQCSDESFYVCDDDNNQPCKPVADPPGFKIDNPGKKTIYLLATDHCFFTEKEENVRRCDCVLFDDTCFCFVEFKLNITRQPTDKAKDAREQLSATIHFFEQKLEADEHFFGFMREAYVVMQKNIYPKNPARLLQIQAEFLKKTRVRLFELDTKSF